MYVCVCVSGTRLLESFCVPSLFGVQALVKQMQMTEVLVNTIFQRQIKQIYICAK